MTLKGKWYALYLRRGPVSLVLLSLLLLLFLVFVTGVSRIFFAQQQMLAVRWSQRGESDLNAHRYQSAVEELRAALRYARDDSNYQLSLAEALMGMGRSSEAEAYLVNLWAEQPENGRINLDLARVAARDSQTQRALRYYHNAIYANWPGDQQTEIRDTRIELIEYLLRIKATAQAQSELISLQVYLGDEPGSQAQLGDLFMRTGDYEHALAAYRMRLSATPHDAAVLAAAGNAAFELGRYAAASHYFEERISLVPDDAKSRDRLKLAGLVLKMDPFRSQISAAERDKAVVADFAVAGDRLKSCPVAASYSSSSDPKKDLSQEWAELKTKVTLEGLRRNPDLLNTSMSTVFAIERQASIWCGAPTDADSALLLISKSHEGI